eukprot:CAMPEP_0182578456 /NCGR_PEP_ID=MMETSP1324-20130603/41080_1 /TAXON_ID=236786 /ORGANISM="Florenciella sp., Strain RCC1587" /LENGTH=158 /DNA_ID=CAMNT_0024794407 /DNA_START=72 /DNA_END=544 /DNA_ORIENTATION=+
MTNMVQHIETGHCDGCRGRENARNAIYNQVSQMAPNFVTSTPMLEYGGYGAAQAAGYERVPVPSLPEPLFQRRVAVTTAYGGQAPKRREQPLPGLLTKVAARLRRQTKCAFSYFHVTSMSRCILHDPPSSCRTKIMTTHITKPPRPSILPTLVSSAAR